LKLSLRPGLAMFLWVAPLAGAWIETGRSKHSSFLTRVAPLAGAWIETRLKLGLDQGAPRVAPLAGAWIETKSKADRSTLL